MRASDVLYAKPWWGHVLYKDDKDGQLRHGRASLTVKGIDAEACNLMIVQRLVGAETKPNCVLSKSGCTRLMRDIDCETRFPSLDAMRLENLVRLEHIVPDFEDLRDRHGLFVFPGDTTRTYEERRAERCWVNVLHPWTRNGLPVDNKTWVPSDADALSVYKISSRKVHSPPPAHVPSPSPIQPAKPGTCASPTPAPPQ